MEYFQYHQKETEQMHWYKRFKFYKLKKIIFQTGSRLKNYFKFKDCVPETYNSTINLSAVAVKCTDI